MDKNSSGTGLGIPIDNSSNELFGSIESYASEIDDKKFLSYIPSFFTTASLPFKNMNKPVFVRKGSQGITLTLTAPKNVPFGKYGRLLLSILTTHAVTSKVKNAPVIIEYSSLSELLRELQLPRQRGKDIQEQLECFTNAAFSFEQRIEQEQQAYLFKHLYDKGEKHSDSVKVTTVSTGNIRFTTGVQYQEISDGIAESKFGNFKIILSGEFATFCQKHAVPIDYSVYKKITSPVGKDIYAWLVFRNNGLRSPVFIPRDRLVEQFMPVGDDSDPKIANVNYSRIIEQINEIKGKYYPKLNIEFDKNGRGVTLYKSPVPVLDNDIRYALITSSI